MLGRLLGTGLTAVLTVTVAAAALIAPVSSASAASTRSLAFSSEAIGRFCIQAQRNTAGTTLNVVSVTHQNIVPLRTESFVWSSPAPFDGPNVEVGYVDTRFADGNALPLTTQQMMTYYEQPTLGWQIPLFISCKMKNAEAIAFHFGAGATTGQKQCRDFNQFKLNQIYSSLTTAERRYLLFQQNQVVLDPDAQFSSGPDWVASGDDYLDMALVVYVGADSLLHIRSNAITVNRDNPINIGPDKKGVLYCQFPSPEYIRLVITGQLELIVNNGE